MKAEEFIESVKEHHWDRSIETYVKSSYALEALEMAREEVRQEIMNNAVEKEVEIEEWGHFIIKVDNMGIKLGDKVKVLIIKKD